VFISVSADRSALEAISCGVPLPRHPASLTGQPPLSSVAHFTGLPATSSLHVEVENDHVPSDVGHETADDSQLASSADGTVGEGTLVCMRASNTCVGGVPPGAKGIACSHILVWAYA
jgi:hypothetical protein